MMEALAEGRRQIGTWTNLIRNPAPRPAGHR
jgi:hypothetical protein